MFFLRYASSLLITISSLRKNALIREKNMVTTMNFGDDEQLLRRLIEVIKGRGGKKSTSPSVTRTVLV